MSSRASRSDRSYGAGSFVFTVDDSPAVVKSVSGGNPVADVAIIPTGPKKTVHKSIANLRYEDVKLEIGMAMAQPFLRILNSFLDNRHERFDASITYADFDRKARSYLDLRDCLLTELTLPACDASSKAVGYVTVGFATEQSVSRPGDGADLSSVLDARQKLFLPANFRFTLGDLPCKRVSKLSALSFKCKVQEDPIGEARIAAKEPTVLETGTLTVTLSAADSPIWQDWYEAFVVHASLGDDRELEGAIEWLAPDLRTVVARVDLYQVGVFKISADPLQAGKDAIQRTNVELYVERARLQLGPFRA